MSYWIHVAVTFATVLLEDSELFSCCKFTVFYNGQWDYILLHKLELRILYPLILILIAKACKSVYEGE